MSSPAMLLLASHSPRRRQLLSLGGWTFRAAAANVDESLLAGESPQDYVLRLAETKARTAMQHAEGEQIVIGADTTVVLDGDVLGKPADAAEAVSMLERLRGRTHLVFTGIAALRLRDGSLLTDLCVTNVPMRPYLDEEIDAYVGSGDPFDKAGAYAIQSDFNPVTGLAGCRASVMGLPLCHLVRTLRQLDFQPSVDVPANCQSHLSYRCPVSPAILRGEQVG